MPGESSSADRARANAEEHNRWLESKTPEEREAYARNVKLNAQIDRDLADRRRAIAEAQVWEKEQKENDLLSRYRSRNG